MNITELREKSLKIAHEARDLLNTIKDDNSNAAEVESQFERMMKDSDDYAARADKMEKIEARERAFDTIVTETPASSEARGADQSEEKRAKAFDAYIRGHKTIGELRAMGITGQDGVITPTTFNTALLTHLVSEGPMLDPTLINMLVTSTGNPIEMPTFNDDEEAVIIGESTAIPEDDLNFGSVTIGAYKYTSKLVKVSNELLQDAAVPVESIVAKALAKRIGRGVNNHLTVGTGVNEPKGIVTAASVGVTAASATGFVADELFKLQHSVDAAYRNDGSYMFNDAFLLKSRTLKNADGTFVWAPGLTVDAPATILGRPYVINPHMSAAFTTGQTVALFGDMKAYTVRRALDIYVRRLSERYADYDQTAFVALARFDGALLDNAAVKSLKLA